MWSHWECRIRIWEKRCLSWKMSSWTRRRRESNWQQTYWQSHQCSRRASPLLKSSRSSRKVSSLKRMKCTNGSYESFKRTDKCRWPSTSLQKPAATSRPLPCKTPLTTSCQQTEEASLQSEEPTFRSLTTTLPQEDKSPETSIPNVSSKESCTWAKALTISRESIKSWSHLKTQTLILMRPWCEQLIIETLTGSKHHL